jgi:hypothetical protein
MSKPRWAPDILVLQGDRRLEWPGTLGVAAGNIVRMVSRPEADTESVGGGINVRSTGRQVSVQAGGTYGSRR